MSHLAHALAYLVERAAAHALWGYVLWTGRRRHR